MAPRVVVSVDFGTSYSTVYLASQQGPTIKYELVRNWRSISNGCFPSQIAYLKTECASPQAKPVKWGPEIEEMLPEERANYHIVQCAKATLHDSTENTSLLAATRSTRRDLKLDDVSPVKDMLYCIYQKVLGDYDSILRQCDIGELPPDDEIQFVFGIPAAWTAHEQHCFMKLVAEAGMPNALCALESEATAACFFHNKGDLKVCIEAKLYCYRN